MVNHGDLLHGDGNGVTNIPVNIAAEVADAAAEVVRAEDIVMKYVKSDGEKDVNEFKARFAELKEEFKKLSRRVSRRIN